MRSTLFVALALGASACSNSRSSVPAPQDYTPEVQPPEAAQLFAPEPQATAEEYRAERARWRLFGVQLGDVRTAVFADTATWMTREVAEGELLARNIRVSSLSDAGASLAFADGSVTEVAVEAEVEGRAVQHAFDTAAVYQGKGRFRVDHSAALALERRRGLGGGAEAVELQETRALKLGTLDPGGALARFGLQEGDLLLDSPELVTTVRRIASGDAVELRVLRRGSPITLRYSR